MNPRIDVGYSGHWAALRASEAGRDRFAAAGQRSGNRDPAGQRSGNRDQAGQRSGNRDPAGQRSGNRDQAGRRSGNRDQAGLRRRPEPGGQAAAAGRPQGLVRPCDRP
jgi:hypothetical protein